ncbi:PTS mannitol transporter subunit IICB [Labedella endophytica]|uniref:PTS system mannitol-specific EIICB component n=1 Tax=Labedella endophytica TaxID=1523160 RepID=A0A3S1CQE8_9MICO|nr:PTS mannitol transporter subunit IICB [Labedella endophytica]RUQ98904.1 PTS mannitol transporter subunit IICB [Labedella endophytica]
MTTTSTTSTQSGGARVAVQRFGTFLSGMIMPNIPALIAWGFITALFIPEGPFPLMGLGFLVEEGGFGSIIGPMIHYLLPLLIANTGGRMVYGQRGGVVGTIATMGAIVAAENHMFIGAMILGPLAAYLMKKLDGLWENKIKAGFEMLVNMFSAGILGFLLAIVGFFTIGPAVTWLTARIGEAVQFLVDTGLLPLTSIIIEPAKVLFLNNAINHGVLTPIGLEQADETGKSILFLLEANPGPGLGILLAFSVFGVGMAKGSAPGAIIVHFLGGIHEIYFPYVLMKPMLILAVVAGGATGVATNLIFGSGLRSPAAPGSIIAILLQTASDSFVGVILSVILATIVTFLIASVILKASRKRDLEAENAGDLSAAIAKTQANKGKESSVLGGLAGAPAAASGDPQTARLVSNIVFACDAGMGSSAMGASVLRNKLKKAGVEGVTVTNQAIANLTGEADLVITHKDLTDRAKQQSPNSQHVSVDNFMNSPKYDEVVGQVQNQKETTK